MPTTKDKLEFVYLMAKHSSASLADCQRLLRFAASLHRMGTEECNRPVTQKETARKIRLQRKVVALCESFNAKAVFGTVGYIRVAVPDGYTNGWNQDGIHVPAEVRQ